MLSGAMVDDGRQEAWAEYARSWTSHLREVREGDRVKNVKSGTIAKALAGVAEGSVHIRVKYRIRCCAVNAGQWKDTWWLAEHRV